MSAVMRVVMLMFCGGAGVSGLTMPGHSAKALGGGPSIGMVLDRSTALLHGDQDGQDSWGEATSPFSLYIYAPETLGRNIGRRGSVVNTVATVSDSLVSAGRLLCARRTGCRLFRPGLCVYSRWLKQTVRASCC